VEATTIIEAESRNLKVNPKVDFAVVSTQQTTKAA